MANPHYLDPVCVTGMDFTAVIVTYKAEEVVRVPHTINFKNHDGFGSVGQVTINYVDELDNPTHSSSDDDDSGGDDSDGDGDLAAQVDGGRAWEGPPPSSDVNMMGVGHTPFQPRRRVQTAADIRSASCGPFRGRRVLPVIDAKPILHRPVGFEVKVEAGLYQICARDKDGSVSTYHIPLKPFQPALPDA